MYVYDDVYLGESGTIYSKTKCMQSGYKGEDMGKAKNFDWIVPYLNENQLDECEVFIKNGRLYNHNGKLINTTGATAIFVMDKNGGVFMKNISENGNYHHSSFLRGGNVTSAGHIVIR